MLRLSVVVSPKNRRCQRSPSTSKPGAPAAVCSPCAAWRCSASTRGNGADTLLLLHGFPTSSHDWSRVWDALAARRRVVALDLPGFGFSAKPASYSYPLLEQADVVELALRELGVARASVIAHDMGTSVATELLARRESGLLHFAIDRLVLMNGSVHAELARLTPAQKLLRRRWLGPLFARVASATTYRLQLRRILGRNEELSDQDLADQFAVRAEALSRALDRRLGAPRPPRADPLGTARSGRRARDRRGTGGRDSWRPARLDGRPRPLSPARRSPAGRHGGRAIPGQRMTANAREIAAGPLYEHGQFAA